MTTRQFYLGSMSLIVLTALVGQILLAWHGKGAQEGLIAIAAGGFGALAALALSPDIMRQPIPQQPIPPPTPPPPPPREEKITETGWPAMKPDDDPS
jgi:hypothetical protein